MPPARRGVHPEVELQRLAEENGPASAEAQALEAVFGFVEQFSGAGQEAAREGMFGPEVAVTEDAPLLDRLIGLTGRDPNWSPN